MKGCIEYAIKRQNGLLFAGWPARFTDNVKQARMFDTERGAKTALSHLAKRLDRRGEFYGGLYVCTVQPEGGAA